VLLLAALGVAVLTRMGPAPLPLVPRNADDVAES
jgi:hypothetical protein